VESLPSVGSATSSSPAWHRRSVDRGWFLAVMNCARHIVRAPLDAVGGSGQKYASEMRRLAMLTVLPMLAGCSLLMPAYVEMQTEFTAPAGYRVTCDSGRLPISSNGQTAPWDDALCHRVSEEAVGQLLRQHPDAEVQSVTVVADKVTNVCYALAGQTTCGPVPTSLP
jgi:hypothetical protein